MLVEAAGRWGGFLSGKLADIDPLAIEVTKAKVFRHPPKRLAELAEGAARRFRALSPPDGSVSASKEDRPWSEAIQPGIRCRSVTSYLRHTESASLVPTIRHHRLGKYPCLDF